MMEAIGDVTASAEVSRVAVVGEEFDSRIQGGVLVSLSFSASRSTPQNSTEKRIGGKTLQCARPLASASMHPAADFDAD